MTAPSCATGRSSESRRCSIVGPENRCFLRSLRCSATDTSHGVGDIGRCIDNGATAFEDIVLRDVLGEYIERGSGWEYVGHQDPGAYKL